MNSRPDVSTVYLVGAGPGDPDLITVKGMDLLEHCDVLVHDSLVPPELVDRCPAPERHYVGKTAGGHAVTQEEITRLLIELATVPGPPRIIVRLKGGDPYVFGRGGEEALACVAAGVRVEVVPGVTAGVAAPAYAGVPVTHRVVSRGVTFVTGHQVKGGVPDLPWESLATSGLTTVFYMGVATLPVIAEQLQAHGLAADTPALVVQEGTTPGQRSVSGTVVDIAERAVEAGIRPPSVSVIGPVVDLVHELSDQAPRPLAGKTIVLVRAEEREYADVVRLRRAGARVLDVPGIRCVPRPASGEVGAMLAALAPDHHVVFTSALAARFFGDIWVDRQDARPVFVAASRAFLHVMQRHGMPAAFAPEITGAGRVLQALQAHEVPEGTTVWLPRSAAAADALPPTLVEAGYDVRPVTLYETVPVPLPADVRSMLTGGRVDAVLFLSGTCVSSVVDAVGTFPAQGGATVLAAAIGPKTAAVASELGLPCEIMPQQPTMKDLVDEVIRVLSTGYVATQEGRET